MVGFLLGHNLASLGVVEWESAMAPLLAEFVALTVGLALVFAAGAHLLTVIGGRIPTRGLSGA